jgi:hypothetical protein
VLIVGRIRNQLVLIVGRNLHRRTPPPKCAVRHPDRLQRTSLSFENFGGGVLRCSLLVMHVVFTRVSYESTLTRILAIHGVIGPILGLEGSIHHIRPSNGKTPLENGQVWRTARLIYLTNATMKHHRASRRDKTYRRVRGELPSHQTL